MSADLVAESTHGNLDEQIAQLMQCKPLSETEVFFILFLFLFGDFVDLLFQFTEDLIFYGSDRFVQIGEFDKFRGISVYGILDLYILKSHDFLGFLGIG